MHACAIARPSRIGLLAALALLCCGTAAAGHYAKETLSAKTTYDDVDYYHVHGSASHPLAVASAFDLALPGGQNVYLRYSFGNLVLRDGVTLDPPAIALADGTAYTGSTVSTFSTKRDTAVFAFPIPADTTLPTGWKATLGLDDVLAVLPDEAAGTVAVGVYLDATAALRGTDRPLGADRADPGGTGASA